MMRNVFWGVFCIHLLAIVVLSRSTPGSASTRRTKMRIHSHIAPPPIVEKKSPVKQVKSPPVNGKGSQKKISSKPAPVKKKEPSPSQKVLQEVEAQLRSLTEEKKEVVTTQICLPKALSSEPVLQKSQGNYGEELVDYLSQVLDLPEIGDVRVMLEIDFRGHLVSFEILEAKSQKNSAFLKKRLPELVLPCFNEIQRSNETRKYTVTFKNLESSF